MALHERATGSTERIVRSVTELSEDTTGCRPDVRIRVGIVATAWADGGAEAYLKRLYAHLAGRGIRGHLFGDIPRWAETGLTAQSIGSGPKWGRGTLLRSVSASRREQSRALEAVSRRGANGAFDLYVAQYKREQITLTRGLSRLGPVIWTEHGRFLRGIRGRGLAAAYRRAARSVAAIVCVSEGVREDVASICGRGHPELIVIPNPVDLVRFRPATSSEREDARRRLGIAPEVGPVLAVVSRLHRAKRIDMAIEATRQIPGAILVVAGDGPDRKRLARLAGGGRVLFTGHLSDPRVVYASADVFMFTSGAAAREGFPTMSILESSASGLPVAVAKSSDLARYVKHAGVFVSEDRAEALADAARRAFGDAEACSAARQWAASHDLDSWADRHHQLFERVVGDGSSRRWR